jgi:hypothetical protein
MSTGLTYVTVDGGEAVGHPDDDVVPHAAAVVALSIPLATGRAFGSRPGVPETELYVGGLVGVVVPFGDSGNAASAEAGFLATVDGDAADWALSVGDGQSLGEDESE